MLSNGILICIKGGGGSMAEWSRALDLKSGGSWFESSSLPLTEFAFGKITNWSASLQLEFLKQCYDQSFTP